MKFLTKKTILKSLFIFLIFLNFNTLLAQEVKVIQDPKIEQLLNEKRKVNASITINNQYKIQMSFQKKAKHDHIILPFLNNFISPLFHKRSLL